MSIRNVQGWLRPTFFLLLVVGALGATAACSIGGGLGSSVSEEDGARAAFKEWQVFDTATGQPVLFDQWMSLLLRQEIIYLGEEHHNPFHIEAAAKVLRGLKEGGRIPTLAMEMFGWDGQPELDRYRSDTVVDRRIFLTAARWDQNWGGPYEDYDPLVRLATEEHWSVVAMSPPKPLVRLVAKVGLAQAQSDSLMVEWGMKDEPVVDDPTYRTRILQQLQACHGGGADGGYERMFEASMFRDEGMAKTLVGRLDLIRSRGDDKTGPLVSYTGGGHIQYNLPVPKRVARRSRDGVRQISVYMTSFEPGRIEEVREMIGAKIADFVWLTPVSTQGPPRRC